MLSWRPNSGPVRSCSGDADLGLGDTWVPLCGLCLGADLLRVAEGCLTQRRGELICFRRPRGAVYRW